MRYIVYARKSSEGEDRQVQSIPDQLNALRAVATERGLCVVDELTESKSAKEPGRPVFTEMIQRLQRGEADAILTWSINRLSRNPVDSGTVSWMLQQGIIRAVQTVDRQYLPDDNVLVMAVESGVANQYILDLRKATMRGTASKVEKGWFPHRPPEGYANDRDTRTIVPDEGRFEAVRRAWLLLLDGQHSVPQIRDTMIESGYRCRRSKRNPEGKMLSVSSTYAMFSNVFYAGYFVVNGEIHRGSHEPMITLAQFEAGQRIIHRAKPRLRQSFFCYRGLIRCAVCGGMVTAERKTKPSGKCYTYYHCNGRGCSRSIREETIEAEIKSRLSEMSVHPAFVELAAKAGERWRAEQLQIGKEAADDAVRAVGAEKLKMDSLLEMRLARLLTDEEYVAKKAEISERMLGLQVQANRLAGIADEVLDKVHESLRFLSSASELFEHGDPVTKNAISKSLGVKYLLRDRRLVVDINPILAHVFDYYRTVKTSSDKRESESPDTDLLFGAPYRNLIELVSEELRRLK